jgi:hypothetical protein
MAKIDKSRTAKERAKAIKKKMNCGYFQPEHFFHCCPYTIDDLRVESRKQDLMQWRMIGVVWLLMCDYNSVSIANYFNKHHSNIYCALDNFENAINGFDKNFRNKIEIVEQFSDRYRLMPREISLKMVVKNYENVKPSTIIARRKKRIDPRKRIWEAIEKHNNREQTFAYHEWIKCNFKSHQLIIQETDCN